MPGFGRLPPSPRAPEPPVGAVPAPCPPGRGGRSPGPPDRGADGRCGGAPLPTPNGLLPTRGERGPGFGLGVCGFGGTTVASPPPRLRSCRGPGLGPGRGPGLGPAGRSALAAAGSMSAGGPVSACGAGSVGATGSGCAAAGCSAGLGPGLGPGRGPGLGPAARSALTCCSGCAADFSAGAPRRAVPPSRLPAGACFARAGDSPLAPAAAPPAFGATAFA